MNNIEKKRIVRYFIISKMLLVDEMKVDGGFACESYGVKVAEQGGDIAVIPNITVSISRIDALVDRMLRNTVSPASARDVVDDWL